MDEVTSFLGRNGYLPHGYCFTWTPSLLWSMVSADTIIAGAYFSIPLAMMSFMRRRGASAMNWLVGLFCAFIFACGMTHVMDVVTIWQPLYGLQAVSKLVTAGISLVTALMLWPLIPKALRIPSVEQLQASVRNLQAEIVQRRQAETDLSSTQEALTIALASIGAGFIACDREGRVVRMNEVAQEVTGWTEAQAQGQLLWAVFAQQNLPESTLRRNPVDVLVKSGFTIDTAHRVTAIARDGRRTPLEVKVALTYAPDASVRGLAMVFRDMTAVDEAQARASQMAAIVESSYDAIIGKTLDGRITSWNRAAELLYGYSADEAIGQPIQMLLPADRVSEEVGILAELSAGARVPSFDTVRLTKDGRLVEVSLTISPVRDAQGKIIGASKIARDITQQKHMEQLRLDARRVEAESLQIQAANRLKSELVASMSHELRSPLNAIIGFASLLHSGSVPVQSPKYQDFLGYIDSSGQQLMQLINDVLDLSKAESGKLEFFPERVSLAPIVAEVVSILQVSANRQGVVLTTRVDESGALDALYIDPGRLKQVLYNCLSNAIKFSRDGGEVVLSASAQGDDEFRIEVKDSGVGMAPDELSHLFLDFEQVVEDQVKHDQGAGLGLALTRRLVEGQGGQIGASSTLGEGSVFHIVLKRGSTPPAWAPVVAGESAHALEADPTDKAPGAT